MFAGPFLRRCGIDGNHAPCAFRVADMEAALGGNFSASALDGISVSADNLNSDIHGSAEYRAHLVTVMAKRAVDAANG